MSEPMLIIRNQGQAILSTNYWESEAAQLGYVYLTWNAGAARVLVPDASKELLREMKHAREVIISRGVWTEEGTPTGQIRIDGLELLWEDDSQSPFYLMIAAAQCDRLIPEAEQGGGFAVTAWTRGGMKGRWPGRYRVVDTLPCGLPWQTQ